ncbi:glycosyltransferase [Cellulomonas endophytica]|uniref:glycosyltransferase n=1 Tax=Cellulomonas endophytica TaxID=2494735 RepID=UPI001012E788|nr:glycosyltransferase [Cellulomonas endophytica]
MSARHGSPRTAPARPVAHVVVVVPARDEEALVDRCLASVTAACARLAAATGVGAEVLLVADGCTDATAERARAHAVRVLETPAAGVGAARALGAATGLAGSPAPAGRTWLLCTDADTWVPPDWALEHVALADAGADLVLGTVRPDPDDLPERVVRLWRSTRVPGRPNGHVHGANLGVRADAYAAVGGFAAVEGDEDVDLVARLRALPDVRAVASDAVDVLTSGRRVGRTTGGYAGYLRALAVRALADEREDRTEPA